MSWLDDLDKDFIEAPDLGSWEPPPTGDYPAIVTDVEIDDGTDKNGRGYRKIKITMDAEVDGASRKVSFDCFLGQATGNETPGQEKARQIRLSQLRGALIALGIATSEELNVKGALSKYSEQLPDAKGRSVLFHANYSLREGQKYHDNNSYIKRALQPSDTVTATTKSDDIPF